MRRQLIIGGVLAVILLGGLLSSSLLSHRPEHRAELLLAVRPFTNALLRLSFERRVISSSPGVMRLDFQTSTFGVGSKTETNAVMRLVAAAATATDAEESANKAAETLRVTLQQSYGATATILSRARSYSASAVREPFRFRFRNATQAPFPTAGPVFFQRPGISINPGDGWMRHYVLGQESVCDPVLTGQGRFNGDFVQAVLLGPDSTTVESGIAELRPRFAQQPGFMQSSCREELFTSESGLHGLHASFVRKHPVPNPKGAGTILQTQITHYYLTTNANSRCAGIVYVTINGSQSEQIHHMIRSTLRSAQ